MNYWLNSLNIRTINKRRRIPTGQSTIDNPDKQNKHNMYRF